MQSMNQIRPKIEETTNHVFAIQNMGKGNEIIGTNLKKCLRLNDDDRIQIHLNRFI